MHVCVLVKEQCHVSTPHSSWSFMCRAKVKSIQEMFFYNIRPLHICDSEREGERERESARKSRDNKRQRWNAGEESSPESFFHGWSRVLLPLWDSEGDVGRIVAIRSYIEQWGGRGGEGKVQAGGKGKEEGGECWCRSVWGGVRRASVRLS